MAKNDLKLLVPETTRLSDHVGRYGNLIHVYNKNTVRSAVLDVQRRYGVRFKDLTKSPMILRLAKRGMDLANFDPDRFGVAAFGNIYFSFTPGLAGDKQICGSELALLYHELEHALRQRKLGRVKWTIRYYTKQWFRAEEEAYAHHVSMCVRSIIFGNRYTVSMLETKSKRLARKYKLKNKWEQRILKKWRGRFTDCWEPDTDWRPGARAAQAFLHTHGLRG